MQQPVRHSYVRQRVSGRVTASMTRLSARSPPRLSRCRVCSPLKASRSATPAREPSAASLRIRRVLTDNGSCYRFWVFAAALAGSRSTHKRTRPYRPQTNGKVEPYHRTMATEWLYAHAWTSNDTTRPRAGSTTTTTNDLAAHSEPGHQSVDAPNQLSLTSLHRTPDM